MRMIVPAACLLLLSLPSPGRAQGSDVPRSTILLFWASWCAPCRAEVRDIAALESAAAPMRVMVVPIEPRGAWRDLLRALRPDQLYRPREGGLALMQRLGGPSPALPLSVAIDADGRLCATQRVAVSPATLTRWRGRCAQPTQRSRE